MSKGLPFHRWTHVRLASLLVLLVPVGVSADDNRPVVVEIVQVGSHAYRISLRVPPSVPVINQPWLELPAVEDSAQGGAPQRVAAGGAPRRYVHPHGLHGQILEMQYPVGPPPVATIVRWTHQDGSLQTLVVAAGKRQICLPAEETGAGVARDYLHLGVHHIWVGTDHLLFWLCLICIADSFPRILATITGFTVAHSITLVLSALDLVRLPVPSVEAVIALSVVFLATEVVKGPRDNLTWRFPISVSCTFGLLHGLGFAAVLNEVGLPRSQLVTGLVFFNLGVEVGQILFAIAVVLIVGMLRWFFRSPSANNLPRCAQQGLGYAVGCIAAFWLIQRAAEIVTVG